MNPEFVRLGAGMIGGFMALLMYGSPIKIFIRVVERKTTEGFSAVPYAISLFNCLIYIWYSTPYVCEGWSQLVVFVVNSIGLVMNLAFVSLYLLYAPPSSKVSMQRLLVGAVSLFGIILVISVFVFHDHKHRKLLVGTCGMLATITLYASPLSVIRTVVRTKSVEFIPISLSIFSTLCSCFWLAYGVLSKDFNIMGPNFLGIGLGMIQMIIYMIYKNKENTVAEEQARANGKDVEAGEIQFVETIPPVAANKV